MRSCFRWIAVIALGVGLLGGCSDEPGPTGGTGGTPECASPEDCDDDGDECTAALCTEGTCQTTPLDDGAVCTEGECHQGACTPVFPCTEQGIRDAIAEGGGPHFFDCVDPTTVETETEILIDNDVILDGEGELTVDGKQDHRVFRVENGVETELRGISVTGGDSENGGGIYNLGTLTLTDSTVSGNTAIDNGGGIRNFGMLTLTNSTVSGNTASLGGGILNFSTLTLTLTNSTVSGNTAVLGGGILNDGTLTLTNSTVSGNTATGDGGLGGGIYNDGTLTLTLTNSTVSDNTAPAAGGIHNRGTLTLTDSTVSGNTAIDGGGGIRNFGMLTLTNSTVSGNTATGDSGLSGGIFNASLGTLTLTNSTVSGNTAPVAGGIHNRGTLTLTDSTVSGNTAIDDGGGIYNEGTATLTNTLMDDPCAVSSPTSLGGNLESPGNTCGLNQATDQFDVSAEDLNLGPLAANGGLTMTHKPGDGGFGEGSAAIDKIPAVDCEVDKDQRSQPRPETGGTMCDVGSVEVQPEL